MPSNPNNADLWRDTDERLQNNNITKYREIQESNSTSGLVLDEQTIAKMAMSEDGYGNAEASGLDESGNPVTITTKARNQEITHNLPDHIEKEECQILLIILAEHLNELDKEQRIKNETV